MKWLEVLNCKEGYSASDPACTGDFGTPVPLREIANTGMNGDLLWLVWVAAALVLVGIVLFFIRRGGYARSKWGKNEQVQVAGDNAVQIQAGGNYGTDQAYELPAPFAHVCKRSDVTG